MRDVATDFIKVDVLRTEPVLTVGIVDAYDEARAFIKPFCNPSFDPTVSPFNLDTLSGQLKAIRLILVKRTGV